METNRVIVDTDVLIGLLRNAEEVVNFIADLEEKRTLLSTTSLNAFELYYGACKSKKREQNLEATRKLLNRLIVLPFEATSAETAGRIYADLQAKGQTIGLRDTLIGAIALTKGYGVATKNTEHFKKIKKITIIPAP